MKKCATIVLVAILAVSVAGCQRSTADAKSTNSIANVEHSRLRGGGVQLLSDATFETEISNGQGVAIVEFFARWCGPCKQMLPIMDALAAETPDVKFAKLDVDAARATADKFNVHGYPHFIIFKDGKEVEQHPGSTTKEEISSWLAGQTGKTVGAASPAAER